MMNNDSPKVSIIIPNYNYEIYLKKRIESILSQTYTNYEIILLDDASTDNSIAIFNEYKEHPKVSHIVINEKNTGSPFKQWAKGIQLAKGDWIWIAEADDLCEPTFLEKCIYYIEKGNNISICNTGSVYIDEKDNILNRQVFHWSNLELSAQATIFNGNDFAEYILYWKNDIPNASGVVFNKKLALELSNENWINMRYCGDWMFWFQMSLKGNVIQIYETLNFFRQHYSQTVKGRNNGQSIIEAMILTTYIENTIPTINDYKKKQKHGREARLIKRIKNHTIKKKIKEKYHELYYSSTFIDYVFFKLNRHLHFLPFTVTEEKDRNKAIKNSKTILQ